MTTNGKWSLAFWLITAICGVWLMALTQGVVANDRYRQDEDKQIRREITQDKEMIGDKLETILMKLSVIETEIKYIKDKKR